MKNFLLIFVVILLLGCNSKTHEDVRKVKVGISTNDLKYIMGEPFVIRIDNGEEEWFFRYENTDFFSQTNGLQVTIVNDKVTDFYSY